MSVSLAVCHPGRKVLAKGLCWACYQAQRPKALCHPDRPRVTGPEEGLCGSCFWQKYKRSPRGLRRRLVWMYGEAAAVVYVKLFEEQKGLCAMCHQPETRPNYDLCLDHDHITNEIRGLICDACNRLLGYAKDDPHRLAAAMEYLLRPRVHGNVKLRKRN